MRNHKAGMFDHCCCKQGQYYSPRYQIHYLQYKLDDYRHQFTMLKLLDCTANDDNTYSYQLNVNPTDNPECFEDVA